jgi:hypothetical protein
MKPMDDRLKQLMQDLGNAINESLSDSEAIAQAIGEIKQAGYDVFLVLEATIGFNKRQSDGEEAQREEPAASQSAGEHIPLTHQDQEFLRAMKISLAD